MKRALIVFAVIAAIGLLSGCASTTAAPAPAPVPSENQPAAESALETTQPDRDQTPDREEEDTILVAYFSNTGNTQAVAELVTKAAADSGRAVDTVEIQAQTPYTAEDLDYNNSSSRANQEQDDPAARPEITVDIPNWDDYDVVMLGYPIWWGQAPKVLYTFVESHDLSGKTVIPFCTSGSSDIGTSASNLNAAGSESALWLEGKRFSGDATPEEVFAWLSELGLA